MNPAIMILSVLATAFLLTIIFLLKTLKQTKASLQELLRESENQEEAPTITDNDIYFKIDNNFNLTSISESATSVLGIAPHTLIGQSLIGNLTEDNTTTKDFLEGTLKQVGKKQTTLNTQMLLKRQDGKTMLMLVRIRPILNEVLDCCGLSFLCKDLSQADTLEDKLSDFQSLDPFTNILNETALMKRFSHDFKLANRYNKELSSVVIELKDIYDFVAKGIDFETADKILKNVGTVCLGVLDDENYVGRVDKTKITIVLKNTSREEALQLSISLFGKIVHEIKSLRIDEANAAMIVISYSNRKGFIDSFDAMISRINRHINLALKQKNYGIISSDKRYSAATDLENIKG